MLRGQGSPRSIFTRWLFLIEVNESCQELPTEWKNTAPSPSHPILKSQKHTQSHCMRKPQPRFPKIDFKIYPLPQFLRKGPETRQSCSRDQNKTTNRADPRFRPQKRKYGNSKFASTQKSSKILKNGHWKFSNSHIFTSGAKPKINPANSPVPTPRTQLPSLKTLPQKLWEEIEL